MKDWNGNKNSIYKTLGASNHTDQKPVLGHISGKRSNTHWVLYIKNFEENLGVIK